MDIHEVAFPMAKELMYVLEFKSKYDIITHHSNTWMRILYHVSYFQQESFSLPVLDSNEKKLMKAVSSGCETFV